jgi:hypothetical protein
MGRSVTIYGANVTSGNKLGGNHNRSLANAKAHHAAKHKGRKAKKGHVTYRTFDAALKAAGLK